jgi:HEPN/RES N-terminal domain 1/RES domain
MGRVKQDWLEQQERGFNSVGEKYICSACFEDEDVINFINENATYDTCDYCGMGGNNISVHFDEFMKFILNGICSEYGDPNDEGVPWEKGWQGDVYDSYDLIFDIIAFPADEAVLLDINESISDRQWCQRGFYQLKPKDVLLYGWNEFVKLVKYKARYVFYRTNDAEEDDIRGHEEIRPSDFLDALGYLISNAELIRTLEKGSIIYRARIHSNTITFNTSKELGPPPYELATYSNRMSPAGIPMFYGAFDITSTIKEIVDEVEEHKVVTVGHFELLNDLLFIDLSDLPAVTGTFHPDGREKRHAIQFLHEFVEDISLPITKDGKEHIEYVPTQIVSEHLRHVYRTADDNEIGGIIFNSSKNGAGKVCVIFIDNDKCCDLGSEKKESVLVLVKVEQVNHFE